MRSLFCVLPLALALSAAACSGAEPAAEQQATLSSRGYGYEMLSQSVSPTAPALPPVSVPAEVTGKVAPEVVRDVLQSALAKASACYAEARGRDPQIAGELELRLDVREDGSVESVKREKGAVTDPALVACLGQVFGKLAFPASSGGRLAILYPLALTP